MELPPDLGRYRLGLDFFVNTKDILSIVRYTLLASFDNGIQNESISDRRLWFYRAKHC